MKKLLAILLAAMMLLSLAACTNNDDNPSGSENNPGTSQSDNQGGTENQGGESTNNGVGESTSNEDKMTPKTFTWPTESYTPEKMKWTGAGAITNVKQEEYKTGKFRMAVHVDDATLDEVGAYLDALKADGFAYWTKFGNSEPAVELSGPFAGQKEFNWSGLSSDGRFVEIVLYEAEKSGDYRNDYNNYVDYNFNLTITLYPEKPYEDLN